MPAIFFCASSSFMPGVTPLKKAGKVGAFAEKSSASGFFGLLGAGVDAESSASGSCFSLPLHAKTESDNKTRAKYRQCMIGSFEKPTNRRPSPAGRRHLEPTSRTMSIDVAVKDETVAFRHRAG